MSSNESQSFNLHKNINKKPKFDQNQNLKEN